MVAGDGPADGLHGLRVLRGFPPACCAWSGVFGTGSRAAPQGCGRSQGPNCTGACAPTRPSPPTEDPQGCRGSYWEVGLNQACVLCVGFCPVLCLSFPGGRCLRLQGCGSSGLITCCMVTAWGLPSSPGRVGLATALGGCMTLPPLRRVLRLPAPTVKADGCPWRCL